MNIFAEIYHNNSWKGKQSRSGPGSSIEATIVVQRELPKLLEELKVKVFLDCPCGDFNWMRHVILPCEYIGVDVVPEIIQGNQQKFSQTFLMADARCDRLPAADLVFSRDFLVHLSEEDVRRVIQNYKDSGIKWLLMTHFTDDRRYIFAKTGSWRPINFCNAPFNYPQPEKIIVEGHPLVKDKSLGLWRLRSI